jgi:hypothetical protein
MLASPRTPSYNPESPEGPNNSAARRYSSIENRPPIYGEFRSSDLYIATVLRSDTASSAQPGRHSYTSQCTAVQQLRPRINWVLRVLGFRSIYRHGCGDVSEFLIEWTDSSHPKGPGTLKQPGSSKISLNGLRLGKFMSSSVRQGWSTIGACMEKCSPSDLHRIVEVC